MATDYRINVTADTKQYKKGLQDQKNQTSQFTKNVNNVVPDFKKSIASFASYAGQIGVATAAQKVLGDQLKSTQQGQDFMRQSQQGYNQGLLQMGNYLTGVRSNFKDTISQAIEFSNTLDDIDTFNAFSKMFTQPIKTQLKEYDLQIKTVVNDLKTAKQNDDKISVAIHMKRLREIFEQRNAAVGQLNDISEKKLKLEGKQVNDQTNAFLKSMGLDKNRLQQQGLELSDIIYNSMVLPEDINDNYIDIAKNQDLIAEAVKRIDQGKIFGLGKTDVLRDYNEGLSHGLQLTKQQYEQAALFYTVRKSMDNDQNKQLANQINAYHDTKQQIADNKLESENWEAFLIRIEGQIPKIDNNLEKPLQTLQDLVKQAAELEKKIQKTSDPLVLETLNKQLKEIEDTIKRVTQPTVNSPVLDELRIQIDDVKKQMAEPISTDEYDKLAEKAQKLENRYQELYKAIQGGANITSISPTVDYTINPLLGADASKVYDEIIKKQNTFNEAIKMATFLYGDNSETVQDLKQKLWEYNESVGIQNETPFNPLIGEIDTARYDRIIAKQREFNEAIEIQSLLYGKNSEEVQKLKKQLQEYQQEVGVATDEEKELQRVKEQNIQSTAGSISTIFDAMDQREQALAFAIAQIVQGAARGIAEQFTTNVWYGIASAQAAQASIQTTIASFKKSAKNSFAGGGIVGGNSTVGDNQMIWANAGEMLLNRSQQRQLFDQLDNGSGSSNNNYSLEVRGSSLVTVMNNTNNKRKKVNYRYD